MLHHPLLEPVEERQELCRNWPALRGQSLSFDGLKPNASDGPRSSGDGKDGSILQEIPAVGVVFLMSAINAVSYGTLLFAALDAPTATAAGHSYPMMLPNGTSVWLLSQLGAQLGTLFFSDMQNGICCPMLEMIPILHALHLTISKQMTHKSPPEVQATCVASCFLCTASIGMLLLLGTRLGLAKYLRAVPLIVLKGALFGVAIFLISSCLHVSAGLAIPLVETWRHWMPAVLLGLLLFALDEAVHSPVAIALSLLAIGIAPSALDALGICTIAELQQETWVFQSPAADLPSESGAWYSQMLNLYGSCWQYIHWPVLLEMMPTMLGIAASASLLMLMDLKAVELLTEREFSLDKELRGIGFSNLLSALLGGGWPCYILCSLNVTCYRLGGRSKFVGTCLSLGAILCLFVASKLLYRLPRVLPGSLFMWLGLVFVKETIVDICSKHTHKSDVFIVGVMALVVKFYGFNNALLVGTLLAMSFFTIRYSGSQVGVRTSGDARFYRAICTRDFAEHSALEELGHLIEVVHISGFLMFASTPAFTDAVRELLADSADGPEWILLNCQSLQGLDYSAALELATLGRKAAESQKRLVITELSSCVQEVLQQARVELKELPGPGSSVAYGLFYQSHYQSALQRCENGVLSRLGQRLPSKSQPLLGSEQAFMREVLKRYFGDFLPKDGSQDKVLDRAMGLFEKKVLEPGAVLWNAGEECTQCACVLEGTLHAYAHPSRKRTKPSSPQRKVLGDLGKDRLVCIAGPGDFIGFLAFVNTFPYEHTALVPSTQGEDSEEPESTSILVLQKSKYEELLLTDPPLGQALVRGFLRQISYEWRELSRLSVS